jgi:hypothetical protein
MGGVEEGVIVYLSWELLVLNLFLKVIEGGKNLRFFIHIKMLNIIL